MGTKVTLFHTQNFQLGELSSTVNTKVLESNSSRSLLPSNNLQKHESKKKKTEEVG